MDEVTFSRADEMSKFNVYHPLRQARRRYWFYKNLIAFRYKRQTNLIRLASIKKTSNGICRICGLIDFLPESSVNALTTNYTKYLKFLHFPSSANYLTCLKYRLLSNKYIKAAQVFKLRAIKNLVYVHELVGKWI